MPFLDRIIYIKGNPNVPVKIRIYKPVETEGGGFKCRYNIAWPENSIDSEIYGVDSIQAIQLCQNIIAVSLYNSNYHKSGQLFWEELGDGYGFPLPTNLRNMAEGADRDL